jgi:hypothetical protein
MGDVIPIRKYEANTAPIIESDYWSGSFPLLELLEAIEKAKKNDNN